MALPRVAVWRRIVRMMRMDLRNPPTTVEGRLKRRIARVLRKARRALSDASWKGCKKDTAPATEASQVENIGE
jgi:hypothetical protein